MTISRSHYNPGEFFAGRHDEKLTSRQGGEPVSAISISAECFEESQQAEADQEDDRTPADHRVRECARAHASLRNTTPIPTELQVVLDRAVSNETLDALGLIDSASGSVTVDIALWRQPFDEKLDDVAWRRVFTWMVSGNPAAEHVSILTPPAPRLASIVGTYSYVVERTPRYGILSVTATEDGWRIVDCWGLIEDAKRIEELADSFAAADLSQ